MDGGLWRVYVDDLVCCLSWAIIGDDGFVSSSEAMWRGEEKGLYYVFTVINICYSKQWQAL